MCSSSEKDKIKTDDELFETALGMDMGQLPNSGKSSKISKKIMRATCFDYNITQINADLSKKLTKIPIIFTFFSPDCLICQENRFFRVRLPQQVAQVWLNNYACDTRRAEQVEQFPIS